MRDVVVWLVFRKVDISSITKERPNEGKSEEKEKTWSKKQLGPRTIPQDLAESGEYESEFMRNVQNMSRAKQSASQSNFKPPQPHSSFTGPMQTTSPSTQMEGNQSLQHCVDCIGRQIKLYAYAVLKVD